MPQKPDIPGVVYDLSTSLRNLRTYGPIAPAVHEPVQNLTRTHIESFNFAIGDGLRHAIEDIPWHRTKLKNGKVVGLKIKEATVNKPDNANARSLSTHLRPTECRQRKITYAGALKLKLGWTLDGEDMGEFERPGGDIPIMVKSNKCHLHGLSPKQLVKCGEEENEFGGYFIINGNEKLLRLLIAQRANYAMAIKRGSWTKKEKDFTEFGVTIRCVKRDGTANTNVLHYLSTGSCTLSFVLDREPFYVPVMLVIRALTDWSDKEIFDEIVKSQEDDVFMKGCVTSMMRQLLAEKKDRLYTQKGARKFLGQSFRSKFREAEFYTDEEICEILLKRCVTVHLDSEEERVRFLCFMIRKLYVFVRGGCAVENPDSPMNQDILTSGKTYLVVLKERLEILVRNALYSIQKVMDKPGAKATKALTTQLVSEEFSKAGQLTRPMQYVLATGNLNPKTLVNLQQTSGFAVVADKINYMRYISHFRSVHRGAFFQEMRTTACRKLLPEAWGFMCPVHTPDGAPCGLLNHLAAACRISMGCKTPGNFVALLQSLGMIEPDDVPMGLFMEYYVVVIDGKVVGWLPDRNALAVVEYLRVLKTSGEIPQDAELGFVPKSDYAGQYPGLFIFLSSMGRFCRPVTNLRTQSVEWIGSFEQVYLNICMKKEEAYEDVTTHMELTEQVFLSEVAAMIPYSDHNQSPRNLYQCQMGKQSMATAVLNWPARADNKLYRIQTPQSPLVRPKAHEYFKMDDHPMGANAIVAVISYTGYDMEDAMIINKGSFERGFGYGSIYKSEFIDLREKSKNSKTTCVFGVVSTDVKLRNIAPDGLPYIGTRIEPGDVLCCYYDKISLRQKIQTWDELEMGIVDNVRCLGSESGGDLYNHVCITIRIPRPPTVGDKFASRHGQKGVCSRLYPVEDMPFTESGMIPDIIFNPHGYPSRMTIGMMIETMAGKVAALNGLSFDATPFVYGEQNTAIDHFGEMLQTAGFNYYGNERMYSGVDGRELEVAIFFGVVYYQRLRHMVSDKYQVRTTGAVDELTGQPIKGRKRGGGTRFGEMERDALIAHGASYLLHDRLFNNSDGTVSQVCKECGSILSPVVIPREDPADASTPIQWKCKFCPEGGKVVSIRIPQVFRYLVAELASCNMKITLKIEKSVA